MSMWGDIFGRNAKPDPDEWEPLTEAEEWGRRTLAEQLRRRHEYDTQHQGDAQADAKPDPSAGEQALRAAAVEALERDHFTAEAGQLAPHDTQCDDGCVYESDADRDARIDHEQECDRLREEELEELDDDGQPDPSDPVIAWNFGTRELTDEEYARFQDYHHRDWERAEAAREADEKYAAWKAANPEEAAEQEAAFEAASRAACPLLWGMPDPEDEMEAGA